MFDSRPTVTGTKTVDGDELLDLLDPPGWHLDALCREYPEIDWFDGPTEPAKAVCGRCLVQTECRAYGLSRPKLQGVWGGTTDADRAKLRAAARKAFPANRENGQTNFFSVTKKS